MCNSNSSSNSSSSGYCFGIVTQHTIEDVPKTNISTSHIFMQQCCRVSALGPHANAFHKGAPHASL